VAKFELPIRQTLHLKAFLVYGSMVTTAQQREIRQRRGATIRPVRDVMALGEARPAARETTAAIAML